MIKEEKYAILKNKIRAHLRQCQRKDGCRIPYENESLRKRKGACAMRKMKIRLSSSQIIILGFSGAILLGTLLLMLPISVRDGHWASFSDALFTSTSAVCVTGLVVQNTATYWSGFGQTVIIVLIQIGGMGVVTMAVAIAAISGKKIGLRQRSTMQEAISAPQVGGIVRLTGFIIRMTVLFELLGAAVMAPVFCRQFGFFKGIAYALFHSISAFCNAGFDLLGIDKPYSSLTDYAANPVITIAVMLLIMIGGIGFMVWHDFKTNKFRLRKYKMQSKVVLLTSLLLIVIPAVLYFFLEYADLPIGERTLAALFQAVTPRTAGFNTTDLTKLSGSGIGLMMILMIIGGSPGSTAGGMKTTTIAVLLSSALSVFRRRGDTHFFGRRIADDTIKQAVTLLVIYLVLFLLGGFVISRVEQLPLSTCLFETASAVGTVGLTLGITPTLGIVSRLILIFLMFVGRVGGLTLIFSASSVKNVVAKLPQEKLTVG